ncbi:MAG TPA: sigma-70 family RNA polymerase sigma factor [Longimicrobiales bacterium]|nr:sigma-70 family RNA polymerase sigma factor [Longimicrobiales bacterium]
MYQNPRRLRRPEERVGTVTNADLPPPATANEHETALVQRLRARDDATFQKLHDDYYSAMLRVARNFVRSREEAEEVIQETWIAVVSGIGRFEGRSTFKTWLFRILMNRARARAKREARMVPFSSFSSDLADGNLHVADARAGSDPEQAVLERELRERIERAVASLPRMQNLVLSLRDIEGWPSEEVCRTLAITDSNQRVLLHRARMKVREQLLPYFNAARDNLVCE